MNRCAGAVVVPDRGGQGQDALQDADKYSGGGVSAVAFEVKLGFEVGDRLQDCSHRLPSEVEITNPRHPLAGQCVPVVSGYRWQGRAWLTVTFPDGHPARIPVQDTELAGAQVAGLGGTVLSVPGIRRLHDLVRRRAAASAGEGAAPLAGAAGRLGEAHVGSPAGTAANESRR